jgi:hypothetical protein
MATLTAVIHGESGAGKSWLADTTPGPRLVLDAEGGSQFTPSRPKRLWNPNVYAPPGVQGCEPGQEEVPETTRVLVRDWQTFQRVSQWLESGNHRFKSVVVDSLTEIQKRIQDKIVGAAQMQTQNWGELLREMEGMVRSMRDLTSHPVNPLQSVIVLALTSENKGKFRPHLQGQIVTTLPGFVDVVGYMYVEANAEGQPVRRMLIQPMGAFVAKDRTDVLTQTYGPVLTLRNPHNPQDTNLDVQRMLATIEQALEG